jgi:hypothetical protein
MRINGQRISHQIPSIKGNEMGREPKNVMKYRPCHTCKKLVRIPDLEFDPEVFYFCSDDCTKIFLGSEEAQEFDGEEFTREAWQRKMKEQKEQYKEEIKRGRELPQKPLEVVYFPPGKDLFLRDLIEGNEGRKTKK